MCRLLCRAPNKWLSESTKFLTSKLKTFFTSKGSWLIIIRCMDQPGVVRWHGIEAVSKFVLHSGDYCAILHVGMQENPLGPEPQIKQKTFVSRDLSPAAGSAWSCWLTRNNRSELSSVKAYRLCYGTPTKILVFNVNKWKTRGNRQRLRSLKNIPNKILTWKNQRNQKIVRF